MTEITDVITVAQMNPLEFAVLEAESISACGGWGQPPHLYALARKEDVVAACQELDSKIPDEPAGSLIPIEQRPLPKDEPNEVLTNIYWPDQVAGCVLVTELV